MKFHRRTRPAFQTNPNLGPVQADPSGGGVPPPGDGPTEKGPPGEGAPGDMPPRRRRWKRKAFRASVRALILVALVLATIGIFVVYYPWSYSGLDRQLKEQFLASTGLALSYDKATIQISRGLIDVARPVLSDPQSGRHLLEMSSLELQIPFSQFVLGEAPYIIRSVELVGPVPMPLVMQEGRLQPEYPWDRLFELMDAKRSTRPENPDKPKVGPKVGLRQLTLKEINLDINEEHDGERRSLLRLEDATFEADFDPDSMPEAMVLTGKFNRRESTESIRIKVTRIGGADSYHCTMDLADFATERDLPWTLRGDLTTSRTTLACRLHRTSGTLWTAEGQARLTQIAVRMGTPITTRQLGNARIHWLLDFNTASKQMKLTTLTLENDIVNLRAGGQLLGRYPFPYDVAIDPVHFPGMGWALLASQTPMMSGLSQPFEAQLTIRGRAAGDLATLRPKSLAGEVKLSGVDWTSDVFPAPLQNVQLDATLTSESMNVRRLRTVVGGIPIELSGTMEGRLLEGQIRVVNMAWSVLGEVEGLMTMIRNEKPNLAMPRLGGKFTGEGKITLRNPREGTMREALGRAQFEGRLMLQEGELRHRWLPATVQRLTGRVDFTREQIKLDKLTGELLGTRFSLDGTVVGDTAFWIDPKVELETQFSGEMGAAAPRLAEVYPSIKAALARFHQPEGNYDLTLRLAGDPRHADAGRYGGTLRLENFRGTLDEAAVNGPLRIERAQIDFTTGTLKLASLQGSLGSMAFAVDGELNPSLSGKLNARLDAPMQEVKERLPKLLARFQVDGTAVGQVSTTLEPLPAAERHADWRGLRTFVKELAAAPELFTEKITALTDVKYVGELNVNDLEMTFLGMPSRLRHVSGTFRFDQTRLWTPQALPIEGGEGSIGMTSTLEVLFRRPGQTPTLRFAGSGEHFPLGVWTKRWRTREYSTNPRRKPEMPADYELDTAEKPSFIIEGRIESNSMSYDRLRGENFNGNLSAVMYREQPNLVSWNDATATVGGGPLRTSGRVFNSQLNQSFDFEKVSLPAMAQALSTKTQPGGIFSGQISGKAALHKGFGRLRTPAVGQAEFQIVNSRMVSNKVFNSLGGLLNLPIFEDVSFSSISGPIEFQHPVYSTKGILFDNPIVHIELEGKGEHQGPLDFYLRLQFLNIAGNVPLVSNVLDVINKLVGKVLRFHVTGTTENPSVTPL